jgi:OmpA-OmpF porin, OOP family
MKTTITRLVLFSTMGFLSVWSASTSRAQDIGWYVKADGGGNITENTDLKEFFGPVEPGTRVKFDPGYRFGLGGGYQMTEWFAAEAEVGFMGNRINSITGADVVHDAWFMNVPFLVNAKLQWPNRSLITPYIGGGVGFSEAILDVDYILINNTSLRGNNADTVFAYQGFAGLRYRLNDRMGLSLEYRYFAADGAEWRSDFAFNTATDRMRFGHTQTHAISLAFDFRF